MFTPLDPLFLLSVVGIWPRFIAPYRLKISRFRWQLPKKHAHLKNLRIVHISDLHFSDSLSSFFLQRITKQIRLLSPDIILFSGDFICCSKCPQNTTRFIQFLNSLYAPLGCFCSLGNHDYQSYVSKNSQGIVNAKILTPSLKKFLLPALWSKAWQVLKGKNHKTTFAAGMLPIEKNALLASCLKQTSFQLLQNQTVVLPCGLNITGLGDYFAKDYLPKKAFASFDPQYLGLVLSHNPDTIPDLVNYPGNWIFAGHSHGGQMFFSYPAFLRKIPERLAGLDYPKFLRGLFQLTSKKMAYVSRGLGSVFPVRINCPPDISFFEFYSSDYS